MNTLHPPGSGVALASVGVGANVGSSTVGVVIGPVGVSVAGEAMLRVRLVANSSAPVDPDHHLILSVNGAQIADEKWDGAGPHVITAIVPSGVVRPGENTVTLEAPGDTGAPADSSWLDWIELTYPRELVMDAGELAFVGQAEAYDLAVPGELAALWDITDPAAPTSVGSHDSTFVCDMVEVSGSYAYVGVSENGKVLVYDVSDPSAPTTVAAYSAIHVLSGLAVGDTVIVGYAEQVVIATAQP